MASSIVCWHLSIWKFVSLTYLWKHIYQKLPWLTILSQLPLDYPNPIGWQKLFLLLSSPNHCLYWSRNTFSSSMRTTFHIFLDWVLNSLNMSNPTALAFCSSNMNHKSNPEKGISAQLQHTKHYSQTHFKLQISCH